jgi:hypothetical protein
MAKTEDAPLAIKSAVKIKNFISKQKLNVTEDLSCFGQVA